MDDLPHRLGLWTDRLRAIAQTGLAFDPPVYDRERYEELLDLAAEMAASDSQGCSDLELREQLYQHWRGQVRPGARGYITPKVGVGAAVFNGRDELLLIQRPSGHWFVPTGWADLGYSPAQVASKEVREETGLLVTPRALIAVYDLRHSFEADEENQLYSLFFLCRLDGGALNRHPQETLAAGFYARDRLPEPLARREIPWVEHAWAAHRGEMGNAYFDHV